MKHTFHLGISENQDICIRLEMRIAAATQSSLFKGRDTLFAVSVENPAC